MNRLYFSFRAWDTKDRKWILARALDNPYRIPTKPTRYGFSLQSSFVLTRFTDIYDRNQRPIYEGDILGGFIATGHTPKAKKKGWFAEVRWNDWSHGWDMYGKTDHRWRFFPSFESCEVVGNIFENPELLK